MTTERELRVGKLHRVATPPSQDSLLTKVRLMVHGHPCDEVASIAVDLVLTVILNDAEDKLAAKRSAALLAMEIMQCLEEDFDTMRADLQSGQNVFSTQ